jgi:hypothetical protein
VSILENKEFNFELVIQDNSDTYELKIFCQNIVDSRLVYDYTPPPFSSIDNFNAVLELASGEYLCLIGDDDGINPDIFTLVDWLKKNNIDAIVPGLNIVYRWPDTCQAIDKYKKYNGFLDISKITGRMTVFDTKKELNYLLRNGGVDYLKFKLPKFYHGIVKKENLDNIKLETGNYIGGLSPDIYCAVALTKYLPKILVIDYPITIPGICLASTSGEAATKTNIGKLEDAIHFRNREHYSWSSLFPRFYSGRNISAESAIASLTDLNRKEDLDKFQIEVLTFHLLKCHPEYKKVILNNFYINRNIKSQVAKSFWSKYFTIIKLKIKYRDILYRLKMKTINNKLKLNIQTLEIDSKIISDVGDIKIATYKVIKLFNGEKVKLKDILETSKRNYR